jgi:pimeloyl-ACP methyl ester carboxylesterase
MPETLMVGDRPIAVERRTGQGPGLFWLGGFRSDMAGAKAAAVDEFGAARGLAVTRFDYSGHGRSGGDFNLGTIGRWLEETEAVFAASPGPQIVIGSSMGGWLALLLDRALRLKGDDRIKGLVLIAPAVDMTDLMVGQMSKARRRQLDKLGYVEEPSGYSPEPYRINRTLIDDGARYRLFGRAIETGCPVAILQGGKDRDVPKEHAMKVVEHIVNDPVSFTLVPDGDHRLSRPEDLALLARTIERMVAA